MDILPMQIGAAFGLAITTIVHNRVLENSLQIEGITNQSTIDNIAPKDAQLKAYQAAQWTAFGFSIIGIYTIMLFLFFALFIINVLDSRFDSCHISPRIRIRRYEARHVRPRLFG